MDPYTRARRRQKKSRKIWWLVAFIPLIVLAFWIANRSNQQPTGTKQTANTSTQQKERETPKPTLVNLQPVVDGWLAKQSADFGIVVYDPANKQVIAQHQPDKKYFAASLYKIFVAYLALVDFQSGAQNPNDILTNGLTRKQCVDKMIRESNSACGEAMMAAMGQEALRKRVDAMGIHNTIFAGITTTAQDSALILQYILESRDLNAENVAFLRDAMHVQDQRFRNGLAKGAPEATWDTKVGWNEQYNYHDIGIMTMPSGRSYIVAILSQNNGSSAPIANFSATIYTALNK